VSTCPRAAATPGLPRRKERLSCRSPVRRGGRSAPSPRGATRWCAARARRRRRTPLRRRRSGRRYLLLPGYQV